MPHDNIAKILSLNNVPIAAMMEHYTSETADIYYPGNYLIFVDQGTLRINANGEEYKASNGEFLLIKKFTHAHYYKNWEENQNGFREVIFLLQDKYIKETISSFPAPSNGATTTKPIIKLKHSPVLEGLMRSMEVYVETQAALDESILILKTKEALLGILEAKPELIHAFVDFARPEKADLLHFMEHSFTQNLSLEQFARLSGRSLATFNRDFRKVFQQPPYQWIKQQRLTRAMRLLTFTNKTPSAVYLEVGFEDLAHFSRSFKQEFGINPSAVEKKVVAQ